MHDNKRTGYDKTVRNPRPRTLKRKNLDIGHSLPDRSGLLELQLPGRLGEPGVEGLKQDTWGSADAGLVGHETESDAAAVDPRAAVGAVKRETVSQILQGASRPFY